MKKTRKPISLARKDSGTAVIKQGWIIIGVRLDALNTALEGAWASGHESNRFRVTDPAAFAKEVERELNREEEDGTTLIHRLFDRAMYNAIDQGAEGVEEHPDQEGET